MTCKDCYGYDWCQFMFKDERNCAEESCPKFKDKAKIAELPCKVGDTIYHFKTVFQKQGRKRIAVNVIEPLQVDRFIIGDAETPQVDCCTENNEWYLYDADDFGKTVFLTREKAEAALEKLKGGEGV